MSEETDNDRRFMIDILLVISIIITLVVSRWFSFVLNGQIAPPPTDSSLPIQWVWYHRGGYVAFRLGSGIMALDLVGFLLPLTLWIVYIIVGKMKMGLTLGRSYVGLFLGTTAVCLLFMWSSWGSVYLHPIGLFLLYLLAALTGFICRWKRFGVNTLLHLTAVWFGVALCDILIGTNFLTHGSGIIAGANWGIGDGLWLTPLSCAVMMMIGIMVRNSIGKSDYEDEESELSLISSEKGL